MNGDSMSDQDRINYWYKRAKSAEELLRETKRLLKHWDEHNENADLNKVLELMANYET